MTPQTQPVAMPPATVNLDWNEWTNLKTGLAWGAIQIGGTGEHDQPSYHVAGVRKTIDGQEYWGFRQICGDTDSPGETILEFYALSVKAHEPAIRMYVNGRRSLRVSLANFEGGIVRDVQTDKQYESKFVLPPGEFHLQAVKPTRSTASRPAIAPASTPAQR